MQGENGGNNEKILLVDKDNTFENNLDSLNSLELGYEFTIETRNIEIDEIKEKLATEEIDSAIIIGKIDNQINLEYVVESLSTFQIKPTILIDTLSKMYTNMQISKLGLTEEELVSMNPSFEMTLTETEENSASGNVFAVMLLSIVLFYAIYFCAYQVSNSIVTEKTSKIMETLVTSTTPRTIVLGKTIGIGIVGLVQ